MKRFEARRTLCMRGVFCVFRKRKRAFTLIEILMVVALTGLVASLTLTPVVYAVRQVSETEETYSDEAALRRTALFMAQDVTAGLRLVRVTVKVIAHEILGGGNDDTLIVASATPAKQNMAVGSVVYKLVQRSFMNDDAISGLYRWVLPGILPDAVKLGELEEKDGQLVVPYVTSLKLSVYRSSEWVPNYEGTLPLAIQIEFYRGEVRREYVFSFPL
jgi:prepilin-type N-terminal cleavage/methylation domain-containing protein